MATTARSVSWHWDRGVGKLVATVETTNGQTVRVKFPLSHVACTFDEELSACGIVEPAQVGDYESVDGFLSRIRRVAKKTVGKATRVAGRGFVPKKVYKRVVPKAIRRAQSRLQKKAMSLASRAERYPRRYLKRAARPYARQAKRYGRRYGRVAKRYGFKAARSKALGAGLAGAAVAFPAVGGPALAGWTAANRAVAQYDRAKRLVAAGRRDPAALRDIAMGRAAQMAAQRASRSHDPRAQYAVAALRSIPATGRYFG